MGHSGLENEIMSSLLNLVKFNNGALLCSRERVDALGLGGAGRCHSPILCQKSTPRLSQKPLLAEPGTLGRGPGAWEAGCGSERQGSKRGTSEGEHLMSHSVFSARCEAGKMSL